LWSIDEIITTTLKPQLEYYANIFHISQIITNDIFEPISKSNKAKIVPLTTPEKSRLTHGISEPGQNRLKVTVTAGKGVRPVSESLIFSYRDYDNVSLMRETNMAEIHA
jgi:hypothetical protein